MKAPTPMHIVEICNLRELMGMLREAARYPERGNEFIICTPVAARELITDLKTLGEGAIDDPDGPE